MTYTRDEVIEALANVAVDSYDKGKAGIITEDEAFERHIAVVGIAAALNIATIEVQRVADIKRKGREVIAG